MKRPFLQSSGNRAILAIALIIASIIALSIMGGYRENAAIATCKTNGGTPVYRTEVQEFPVDNQGTTGINQEYQVFDYCDYNNR